jgi:signal transduction histidine kinase
MTEINYRDETGAQAPMAVPLGAILPATLGRISGARQIVTATMEQLAEHAARLARHNEALDDAAGLVAHEVKSTLLHALRDDQPTDGLIRALDLVDTVLETVRAGQSGGDVVPVREVAMRALSDLAGTGLNVIVCPPGVFPLPSAVLRIVFRNLLANAVAAGAENVHISTLSGGERQILVVDDDGAGLQSQAGYVSGEQLGLSLCRRLVARFGGTLELKPRPAAGTRALIRLYGDAW